jgi:hypothetical protein
MTGSNPASRQILLEAMLFMRAVADALSVKFAAGTYSCSQPTFLYMVAGDASRGGAISAVVTNSPLRRLASSRESGSSYAGAWYPASPCHQSGCRIL